MVAGQATALVAGLVDRHRARFFDLHFDEVKEQEALFGPLPRRGRGDGFAGYDAGHAERSVSDEALHHFKNVAELLKQGLERGAFDRLVIGCQDTRWHDFEAHLHPYVKKRLLGRFVAEVGSVTGEQVRQQGERMLQRIPGPTPARAGEGSPRVGPEQRPRGDRPAPGIALPRNGRSPGAG